MPPVTDAYWLALRRTHGVGPRTCRVLLDRFKSAENVFAATEDEIVSAGVPRPTARAVLGFRNFTALEKELCELPRLGAHLVRWTDAEYPVNLREIPDPPPYLFVRGKLAPDDPRCVAIVGARAASDAGRRMAQRLGLELAARGFTVVSGLARGIDADAHQGALDGRGRTLAVMGCGIDLIYPPEHRKLAATIMESGGALLSELPLGTPPLGENFPGRNRILSGLSLGVVVVEAAERSGSLITARLALEQNRQVFAVPGSPLSGKTRGSNRLLKEGAKLVECVEDVIEELAPQLAQPLPAPPPAPVPAQVGVKPAAGTEDHAEHSAASARDGAEVVLSYLKKNEKLHVDAIIEGLGLSPQVVLRALLELELSGRVVQHPGKLFSLA